MRLPRSIDNRLRDAIVSFQFAPGVPPETVVGYVYNLLKGYVRIAPPTQPSFLQFSQIPFAIENKTFYLLSADGNFRIDIDPKPLRSILFRTT